MTPEQKQCQSCGEIKYKSQFHKRKNIKSGVRSYCKLCEYKKLKAHREENPTKSQKARLINKLKYRYNISYERYQELEKATNNTCYICGDKETAINSKGERRMLSVDHDHKTGEVRGLLCHRCNAGLGYFRDNISLLKTAVDYLGDRTLFYAKKKINGN